MSSLHGVEERSVTTDTEWFLDGVRARGAAAATVRSYAADLAAYDAWLADRDRTPATATRVDVRGYAAALAGRGLAPASRARALSAIRSLHRRLHAAGRAAIDAAAELPGPRRPRRLPDAPRAADVKRLLDVPASDEPLALRDQAILEVIYGCGLRVSEACALDVADVGLREVRVTGKGDKVRLVPIGECAAAAVARWLVAGRPAVAGPTAGVALFVGRRGGRIEPTAIRRILSLRLGAAGLDHVSPHALRHAYATHMLEGGGDLRAIQELLGHASLASTEIYTRVTVSHLRSAHATAHPRS
jgi:site-specific recombinase XerD